MGIFPDHDVLRHWEDIYVPKRDIFFISKKLLKDNTESFLETLIFERKLFFQHSEYNTLQYNNFYGYWNISKDIDYCIVATLGWYEQLNNDLQEQLLQEQIKSKSYAVMNNAYILTNMKWQTMSAYERHDYFDVTIKSLNENDVLQIPDTLPDYIKEITNTYSKVSGSNCFGVVLYIITKNSWFLSEWVYAENLIWMMDQANYKETNVTPTNGDILIWYQDNDHSTPQYV